MKNILKAKPIQMLLLKMHQVIPNGFNEFNEMIKDVMKISIGTKIKTVLGAEVIYLQLI